MAVKSKYRLPRDIKRLNPDSLNRNHLLVMLDFLGYPIANQAKDKKAKVDLLTRLISEDADKVQVAYDVIVWAKLPDVPQDIEEKALALKSHYTGVLAQMMNEEQTDMMRAKMTELAEALRKNIENAGKLAVEKAAKSYRPVVIKQGKKRTVVKGILPNEFPRIVQLASQRVPTMLVGPAGCGKTYIAGKVAESLDLDFYDQSCSEGVSESTFTGWLLPIGASGAFTYVPAPFIKCYENGGVFLLDEVDASDPNLMTFLNKAVANDSFMLPQRHKKPLVKKHKDFVIIAAANTFGKGADAEYVGRNALDAATLDRYRAGMVHMDYSSEVESALVNTDVLAWGRLVRACIYKNKLRRIMSTRVMLDLTKMTDNCDWTQEDWEKAYFADWSDEELKMWRDSQVAAAA